MSEAAGGGLRALLSTREVNESPWTQEAPEFTGLLVELLNQRQVTDDTRG